MEHGVRTRKRLSKSLRLLATTLLAGTLLAGSAGATAFALSENSANNGSFNSTKTLSDPVIADVSIANGEILHGTVSIVADVSDGSPSFDGDVTLILNSASGKLANLNMATTDGNHYTAVVNTRSFEPGQENYTATINATNAAATGSATYSVIIDNAAPRVTVTSLTTTSSTPQLTGTVDDQTAIVSVAVNGASYRAMVDGAHWSAQVDRALKPGAYLVRATATDVATNSTSSIGKLVIQNSAVAAAPSSAPTDLAVAAPQVPIEPAASVKPAKVDPPGRVSDFKVIGASTDIPNQQTRKLEIASGAKPSRATSGFLVLGWRWLPIIGLLLLLTLLYRGVLNKADSS